MVTVQKSFGDLTALKRSRPDEQRPHDTGNMQKEARHHYSIAAFCLLSEQSYLQRH
jgi:hypothetical protein